MKTAIIGLFLLFWAVGGYAAVQMCVTEKMEDALLYFVIAGVSLIGITFCFGVGEVERRIG